MIRFMMCIALAMSMAALQPASQAEAATVVTWDTPAPDDFDDARLTFAGFTANAVTGITGPGFFHDLGNDRLFSMELQLDGVWTVIGSSDQSLGLSGDEFLSDIDSPLLFASALVTGIGFFVDAPVGFAFNNLTGTQFTFDTVAETPLPAALPLFGTGLGVIGLFGWRKRRRAATP